MPAKSSLVVDDRPLLVLPRLAAVIGLDQAIVVQQLHYLLSNPANGRALNGRRWVFNTYAQWRAQYFPFWSERTIRRAFNWLEATGVVSACQPDGRLSRRKYYRVNESALKKIVGATSEAAKLATSNRPKRTLLLTQTSHRDDKSEESEGTPSVEGACVESEKAASEPGYGAMWKPDERTKEEKLRTLRPPTEYPSEREFERSQAQRRREEKRA